MRRLARPSPARKEAVSLIIAAEAVAVENPAAARALYVELINHATRNPDEVPLSGMLTFYATKLLYLFKTSGQSVLMDFYGDLVVLTARYPQISHVPGTQADIAERLISEFEEIDLPTARQLYADLADLGRRFPRKGGFDTQRARAAVSMIYRFGEGDLPAARAAHADLMRVSEPFPESAFFLGLQLSAHVLLSESLAKSAPDEAARLMQAAWEIFDGAPNAEQYRWFRERHPTR